MTGNLKVVDADDREVAGDHEATLLSLKEDTDGKEIVAAHHGCRGLGEPEELRETGPSAGEGKWLLRDPGVRKVEPFCLKRPPYPGDAQTRTIVGLGKTRNHAEPSIPDREKMPGCELACLGVVEADRIEPVVERPRQHHRYRRVGDESPRFRQMVSADQNEGVDAAPEHGSDLGSLLGGRVFVGGEQELKAVPGQGRLQGLDGARENRVVERRDDGSDRVRSA